MLHQRVKLLCAERGISIWELERHLKIGNGTVGKWANQSRPDPRISTIKSIADYFGVTVDSLIREKE